ncbi:putative ATP-grasp protein [Sinorhizobium phage phiM6]|nr:putative ATP-grasp protein [Sinorhizobium phage phiM6]
MAITGLFAYSMASAGSKELADALRIKRFRMEGSKFVGNPTKVVINWGATPDKMNNHPARNCTIINPPEAVQRAVNKLDAFRAFQEAGVPHPEWTEDFALARRWVEEGTMVFARTQLRAHSGRGIHIMDPDFSDTWDVRAPLYVKYVPKKHEYRVHVFRGEVIDFQRKGLREENRGQPDVNWKIQNLANGFVYVRNDGHVPPQTVLDTGIAAVRALGLDFGAADIIYNQKRQAAYCLEVNSAPGLTGTTVENYATAFRRHFA